MAPKEFMKFIRFVDFLLLKNPKTWKYDILTKKKQTRKRVNFINFSGAVLGSKMCSCPHFSYY